jgi:hypothetical protein
MAVQQEKPEDRSSEVATQQALLAARSAAEAAAGSGDTGKGVEIIDSDAARLVVVVPRNPSMFINAIGGLLVAGYVFLSIWKPLSLQPGSLVENAIPFFRANPFLLLYIAFGLVLLTLGLRGLRSLVFGERYVLDWATRRVSRGSSVLAHFDEIEAVELRVAEDRRSTPSHSLRLSLKNGKKIDVFTVDRSGGLREAAERIGRIVGVPISPSQE